MNCRPRQKPLLPRHLVMAGLFYLTEAETAEMEKRLPPSLVTEADYGTYCGEVSEYLLERFGLEGLRDRWQRMNAGNEHFRFGLNPRTQDPFIECRHCGAASYNENDIAFLYCGRCHVFHRDRDRVQSPQ
jgi:ribosomal protein L37E